ncbi:hypothetical protein Taro_023543 [Colocasia esculenta]|uniref:Uncharacterized protein n=1 Tax=Colocasia esculenta TaxID=4460 RepID=A0A843UXP9_COLES|nr:hypothetical protein [Colocasia esculenta]
MRCVFRVTLDLYVFQGRPLVSTLLDLVSTHCPKLAQKKPSRALGLLSSAAQSMWTIVCNNSSSLRICN